MCVCMYACLSVLCKRKTKFHASRKEKEKKKYLEWKIRKQSSDIKWRVKQWDGAECIDSLQWQPQEQHLADNHRTPQQQLYLLHTQDAGSSTYWPHSSSQALDCYKNLNRLTMPSRERHTIPYHTIQTAMMQICHEQWWGQLRWPNAQALPEWEGKIGSVTVYRCRWCAATSTFCWHCVCVVCAREKEG